MARLQDYFQKGDETLADVTLAEGAVVSGDKITIPLTKPTNDDVQITVLEQKGQAGMLDKGWNMRQRFHPENPPNLAYDNFYKTQAGTGLDVQIARDPADTDQSSNQFPDFRVEARPSSGSWTVDFDGVLKSGGGYIVSSTTKQGCVLAADVVPTDTNFLDCHGRYLGTGAYLDGTLMKYSTTQPQDNGNQEIVFKQRNNGRDKWNYYPGQTWMSSVSTDEVIFHLGYDNNSGYTSQMIGQLVEMDAANDRCRGKGMTFNSPSSKYWQYPYDVFATSTGGDNVGSQFLTKGYKMTKTEQGPDINITGSTLTWVGGAGATTYPTGNAGNFNHFAGAVIKVWDGADATKYRVWTITKATDTTSALLTTGVDYGGYTYPGDGAHANYEIWVYYDFAGGDDAYTAIPLFTLPADTWGSVSTMAFPDIWGTTTNPHRGSFYSPDVDEYTKRSSVLYQGIWSERDGSFVGGDTLTDYEQQIMLFDFNGVTLRDGTDISTGLPLSDGEYFTTNWGDGFYSHNGTDWYRSAKDPRSIRNNFQHTGASDTRNLWFERRCVKYESGTWWMNNNGNGETIPEVLDDPDTFKTWYEGETWVDTGYTDVTNPSRALGAFNWNMDTTWTTPGFPNQFYFNTRMVNQSGNDRTYQYAGYNQYVNDIFDEFAGFGMGWEQQGGWGNINIPSGGTGTNDYTWSDAVRYTIAGDGSEVYVSLSPRTEDNVNDTGDNITFNKLRIIVKGTPI